MFSKPAVKPLQSSMTSSTKSLQSTIASHKLRLGMAAEKYEMIHHWCEVSNRSKNEYENMSLEIFKAKVEFNQLKLQESEMFPLTAIAQEMDAHRASLDDDGDWYCTNSEERATCTTWGLLSSHSNPFDDELDLSMCDKNWEIEDYEDTVDDILVPLEMEEAPPTENSSFSVDHGRQSRASSMHDLHKLIEKGAGLVAPKYFYWPYDAQSCSQFYSHPMPFPQPYYPAIS